MSYMGSTDRFGTQTRRDTERMLLETDKIKADLAYQAMTDVNRAEDSIRLYAQRLRDRADEATRSLDGGGHLGQISVASLGEDLNRVIAERKHALHTLLAILGEDGLKAALAGKYGE